MVHFVRAANAPQVAVIAILEYFQAPMDKNIMYKEIA